MFQNYLLTLIQGKVCISLTEFFRIVICGLDVEKEKQKPLNNFAVGKHDLKISCCCSLI